MYKTARERFDARKRLLDNGIITQHELVALTIYDMADGASISTESLSVEVRQELLDGLHACISSQRNLVMFCSAHITITDQVKATLTQAATSVRATLESEPNLDR